MIPCCLTIAGSDSGGNAGVQADLRAFHAFDVHGCTVFTALTAQNPGGVRDVRLLDAPFVAAQLDAVLDAYAVKAAKTGMCGSPAAIETIAGKLSAKPEIRLVVDPVMVATSGASLAADESIAAMTGLLFPVASLVTPNIPEAQALCGAGGVSAPDELARRFFGRFGRPVLVKGGHATGRFAVDCCYDGHELRKYSLPVVENPVSTHGTGCTLSAAIAACIALGCAVPDAIEKAKRHVRDAIAASAPVGPSAGVLGFAPART